MKHAIELFKQGRYNIISERMIEVDNQTVSIQEKRGREILTCSCENAGRFGSNQLCRHKVFFIMFPFFQKLDNRLQSLEDYYEGARQLNKQIKPEYILEDIKELRRMK